MANDPGLRPLPVVEDPTLGETMVRPPGWNPNEIIPEVSNGDMTIARAPGYSDGVPPNWWMDNTPEQETRLNTLYNIEPFTDYCATGQACGAISGQVDSILKGGDGVLPSLNGGYSASTFRDIGVQMTTGLSSDQLYSALSAAPDGSTFLVAMYPNDGSSGHVFNAQNFIVNADEGPQTVTMFVDGQLGGQQASANLEKMTGAYYGTTDLSNFTYGLADTSNARIDNPNLLAAEELNFYSDSMNAYATGTSDTFNLIKGAASAASSAILGRAATIGSGAMDLAGGPVGLALIGNAVLDQTEVNTNNFANKNIVSDIQTLEDPNATFLQQLGASGNLYVDEYAANLSGALHEVNALPGQILQTIVDVAGTKVTLPSDVAQEQAIIAQQYGGQPSSNPEVAALNLQGAVLAPDGVTLLTPAMAALQYPVIPTLPEITVTAQSTATYGSVIGQSLIDTGSSIYNYLANKAKAAGNAISNAASSVANKISSMFSSSDSTPVAQSNTQPVRIGLGNGGGRYR